MISAKALSDALTALGAFTEAPTDTQLAAAELAQGSAALVARLSNALYGCALAHVMTAEVTAHDAGVGGQCRADAWQATGATVDNITLLLHYTAMRLSADLRVISEHLPAHPQVTTAAVGATEALTLLLEICTVHSPDDPRADAVTTNLTRAANQLTAAAGHLNNLVTTAPDITAIIRPR